MAASKKVVERQKQQLLIFWFCSVRKDLLRGLVKYNPNARKKWGALGIAETALESVRKLVTDNEKAFMSVAKAWQDPCHPPPCPDNQFLGEVALMIKRLPCKPRK